MIQPSASQISLPAIRVFLCRLSLSPLSVQKRTTLWGGGGEDFDSNRNLETKKTLVLHSALAYSVSLSPLSVPVFLSVYPSILDCSQLVLRLWVGAHSVVRACVLLYPESEDADDGTKLAHSSTEAVKVGFERMSTANSNSIWHSKFPMHCWGEN